MSRHRFPLVTTLPVALALALAGTATIAMAQDSAATTPATSTQMDKRFEALDHRLDTLEKAVDDVLWYHRVGDVAAIDKVFITGPPRAHVENPTAMGANNPLKFWAYTFVPRDLDRAKKHPLIVLPHGGVHANFTTYHTHIIRELMAQGYVVVAPEYRGSTGYGKTFYENIDYGGLEIADNNAARDFMVENFEYIDGTRVGVVGWSHGGLIALMDIFENPSEYAACFAGVPVSDLVARMGYYEDDYREEFSAAFHIGKTANEDVAEYRRRSPVNHAAKLATPLLIHTNTNDDDVNVLEVEHLIRALKAEDKEFEYEIFQDVPGGHSFDRIDTRAARETRVKIWKFLAKYLSPATPIRSLGELDRAAYRR